jgi:hypothetical protein
MPNPDYCIEGLKPVGIKRIGDNEIFKTDCCWICDGWQMHEF